MRWLLGLYFACVCGLSLMSSYAEAKHLFVFDLYETLTKENTFAVTKNGITNRSQLAAEFKPGVASTLMTLMNAGHLVGIATFHTRPDVVRGYLEAILPPLYVQKIFVMTRGGLLSSLNSKNDHVFFLVRACEAEGHPVTGITFYDNNPYLVRQFREVFAQAYTHQEGTEAVLVVSEPDDEGHFAHALNKLRGLQSVKSE